MEEKLFDLLEAKAFNELTEAEEKFVLEHVSKEAYLFQRNVILALPGATTKPLQATPLSLPQKKKTILVPLWQVLTGAACLILAGILIFANLEKSLNLNSTPQNANLDTVIVKKIDTVYLPAKEKKAILIYQIDTIEVVKYIEKKPVLYQRDITKITSTQGTSLKEDRDLGWVPKQIAL